MTQLNKKMEKESTNNVEFENKITQYLWNGIYVS